MPRRSQTGLMLVDNPRRFFQSLCTLENTTFSRNEYKINLAKLFKKGTIHDKTRDTYLYTATILNLVNEVDKARYELSPLCYQICHVMNDPFKKDIYRRYLRGLLLGNETKGTLFREFLEFTANPKTEDEIIIHFRSRPAKTLIAFTLEAGLLTKVDRTLKSGEVRSNISINEFYSAIVKVYADIQKNPIYSKMIYVPVNLLRKLVTLELGLEKPRLFDELLANTLDTKLGKTIFLHGAPPQLLEDSESLIYRNKRYAYISVRA